MPETVANFKPRIAPELAHLERPLTDAQPHPENARKHDLAAIKASLLEHSQRSAIVVQRSTGYVVKGNGTWEAARQLGWSTLAQDWQEIDDRKAYAYLLADNRASDRSQYDPKKLRAGLEKMVAGPGLEGTLWEIDELEDLIASDEAPVVEAPFRGTFAESDESRAARLADSQSAEPGQKRREIPIILTAADHALFIGWLATLKKRWGVTGTMATIFAAVKRQAEAEEGAVRVGAPLTENAVEQERQAALAEFRDLIITLGVDRTHTARWIVDQLNLQIGHAVSATVQQTDEVAAADLPTGEDPGLPSHLENLELFSPPLADAVEEAALPEPEAVLPEPEATPAVPPVAPVLPGESPEDYFARVYGEPVAEGADAADSAEPEPAWVAEALVAEPAPVEEPA